MQLKQVADVLRREIRSPARALLAVVPLVLGTLAAAGPARAQGVTAEDAVVLIRTTSMLRSARGSGFIIGDGSWVVTASHVVSADLGKGRRANDTTALVYSPWTGRPYEAKVVAVDGVADIALLRMPQPGFPALAVEGLGVTEATAALAALKDRPLRLYGFPLSYGEATVAALAKPEHNDSKLREIAKRGETSLCVMGACPDVQPGWSGGPMVSTDRGTVVGVFHSLYRPKEDPKQGYPAGSVAGYLGDLLQRAGVTDLKPFGQPAPPTLPRAPNAAERMAHEMRSLSWSAGGDWKRAEEEQRAILKLAPEDALARVELGKLLSVQKKHEEAVKELQEAVRLAPKSLMANLYLGRALHLSYDTKAAIAALRAAAEVSPNEAEPHLTLAEVHEADQKPDEAEAVLRAAMQNVPTHPGIVFRLGNLLMRMKRDEEGLKLLSQASALAMPDPGLSFIPLGYALALDRGRKFREAEAVYRSVIRADPESGHAYFYLAQLLLRQRRPEEAQLQLNIGIRLKSITEEMVAAFQALQVKITEKSTGAN